jgi:hypothetical protein
VSRTGERWRARKAAEVTPVLKPAPSHIGEKRGVVLAGMSHEVTALAIAYSRKGPVRRLTDTALFREVNGYCLATSTVG